MKGHIVFTVTNDLTGDQRMHRIASALANHGYKVTLIGRRSERRFSGAEMGFESIRLKCLFNRGKAFYAAYNLRLFWKLLFFKADVLGAVDLDTALPVMLVSRLRGKKWTYDAHELFTEVPEVHERRFVKAFWTWVERMAVSKAQACYTVNQSLARIFQEKYGVQFAVVRNLAVTKSFEPVEPKEQYILYQGALNRGRGLEALITAMLDIPCRLEIIGTGDVEVNLKAQVSAMKLEHKITFRGFLPPDELVKRTAGAFMGYNVLENDGLSYYYSLANKTFDYMQAGIPVLCSKFPEYEHLSKAHPFIAFTNVDPESISSAVNLLIDNPGKRAEMAAAARAAAEILHWDAEKAIIQQLYDGFFTANKKENDR